MKKYIGTKMVEAKPMISCFNDDGYMVKHEDGYESWSPASVFNAAYRRIDSMTFGLAIEAMKKGLKVQRKGWNGKGMFIYIQKGSVIPAVNMNPEVAKHLFGDTTLLEGDATVSISPHIDMKSAGGSLVIGWLASQADSRASYEACELKPNSAV